MRVEDSGEVSAEWIGRVKGGKGNIFIMGYVEWGLHIIKREVWRSPCSEGRDMVFQSITCLKKVSSGLPGEAKVSYFEIFVRRSVVQQLSLIHI